jgi:glycosyltransferase involved in cell wall biosynthesis
MEPSNQLLVELIRQLNIEGNVILAGQQADIPAVMSGLDIHVLSSKSGEGFPNVVAESMACETPAVSTDVGDAALIVGREDCICQPNSPNALADIILGLIDEMNNRPDEWRMRGKNCRSRVVDGFSLERAVKSFEAVWDV